MPQTACATMATAVSFSPCSRPAPSDPSSAQDEFVAEVGDTGDRTAERGQAELEKDQQDLQRRARAGPLVDGVVG